MPYAYYRRLSSRDKATYRASDAITAVNVPEPAAVRAHVPAIARGLAADDRRITGAAVRAVTAALCQQLGAAQPIVRVLARRPSDASAELHGLYEREQGKPAIIRVWMRTAAHERPVALRTFVRTLLHELCHHFDFELHRLRDTFHTEGFFRRESSLARQLLPPSTRTRTRTDAAADAGAREPPARAQLELFARP
ncbi:MAG: hypothetical protein U0168_19895 [Nannocystaceae bacterium]